MTKKSNKNTKRDKKNELLEVREEIHKLRIKENLLVREIFKDSNVDYNWNAYHDIRMNAIDTINSANLAEQAIISKLKSVPKGDN